jgi:hypothetical protein
MNDDDRMMQFRQGLDQMGAALRDVADVVATYYRKLRDGGVDEFAAGSLAQDVQAAFLEIMFNKRADQP